MASGTILSFHSGRRVIDLPHTPSFFSPEQPVCGVQGGSEIFAAKPTSSPKPRKDEQGALTDPKRDVWSLGAASSLLIRLCPFAARLLKRGSGADLFVKFFRFTPLGPDHFRTSEWACSPQAGFFVFGCKYLKLRALQRRKQNLCGHFGSCLYIV